MENSMVQKVDKNYLIESYNSFLIDAYGVLVRGGEVIPGAVPFIKTLLEKKKEFLLLSNDASRTVESTWKKYTEMGFPFSQEHIVTSGMMIKPFYQEAGLIGAKTLVIGPPDSVELARLAGAEVVTAFSTDKLDAVVICDERQEDLIESLNFLASQIMKAEAPDEIPHIILVNPDLLYPMVGGNFGITAGSIAAMIRTWTEMRFGQEAPEMHLLGKPSTFIYRKALEKLSDKTPLMIGDQILTDIAGSHAAKLRSCLSLMGVVKELASWHSPLPHYTLSSWE